MYTLFRFTCDFQKSVVITLRALPLVAILFNFFMLFKNIENPMIVALVVVYSLHILAFSMGCLTAYTQGLYEIFSPNIISFGKISLSNLNTIIISGLFVWFTLVIIPEKFNFSFWLTLVLCFSSFFLLTFLNNILTNIIRNNFAKNVLLEFKDFINFLNFYLKHNKPDEDKLRAAFVSLSLNCKQLINSSLMEIKDSPLNDITSFIMKIRSSKPMRIDNLMRFKPDPEDDHLELISLTDSLLAEFKEV